MLIGRHVAAALRSWAALLFALGLMVRPAPALAADEGASNKRPVKAVGDQRLPITTPAGTGFLVLYASRPLGDGAGQADIDRAVIVLHGRLRDADVYFDTALEAARAAPEASRHALLVVPQFLAERDVEAHDLPADTLRWSLEGWMGGGASRAPAPIGSYEALDALLALFADRGRFPALKVVVIAGHSAGAQVAQRYAVVGQGEAALAAAGIKTRYVVANPSSYVYFNRDRPQADGTFAPPPVAVAATCPGYDAWKYGFEDAPLQARLLSPAAYEARYLKRDVVYLFGALDTNPAHPALDRSCAAETQGPFRLARGHAYVAYLRARHPGFAPAFHDIPGVGHDGRRMLGSTPGLAALFDAASGTGRGPK